MSTGSVSHTLQNINNKIKAVSPLFYYILFLKTDLVMCKCNLYSTISDHVVLSAKLYVLVYNKPKTSKGKTSLTDIKI